METSHKVDLAESKKSFFNRAAWFSLFTPVVTFGVTVALFRLHVDRDLLDFYLGVTLCLQIISLILGIVSLFGIPQHGARLILWKAVIGILASCGMAYVSYAGLIFNGLAGMH